MPNYPKPFHPSGDPNPGSNPTIVSYNASAVKIYNATGFQVRLENKKIFCSTLKN
jgi:hypothetical protein